MKNHVNDFDSKRNDCECRCQRQGGSADRWRDDQGSARGDSGERGGQVVDATGLLLLPGGIDAHTHLDMPFGGSKSADDFETGTRAAAIGGTTTIVDFAIQAKGTKMRTALDTWWKKAEGKACIDYGLHMIVTDLGTRAWKTWTTWCARAWPASSCSWRIPTC
jgi:hypothetical protein